MAVSGDTGLLAEIDRLRAELARREQEAAEREQLLQRYASDLSTTYNDLQRSYMATVRALANWVEARDQDTGKHAERVAAYGLEIGRMLEVPLMSTPATEFGFVLHDVGKVAIADAILYKPGPLTAEERAVMERHPIIGAQIISEIQFLGDAATVVRSHHERWDGRGYPDGLAGEAIPRAARVFAVGDVLDALTTNRPYRPASPLPEAREMIARESGTHFDPQVVAAFMRVPNDRFAEIRASVR
jgi:ribonuclease P protein subunit RPR2